MSIKRRMIDYIVAYSRYGTVVFKKNKSTLLNCGLRRWLSGKETRDTANRSIMHMMIPTCVLSKLLRLRSSV